MSAVGRIPTLNTFASAAIAGAFMVAVFPPSWYIIVSPLLALGYGVLFHRFGQREAAGGSKPEALER